MAEQYERFKRFEYRTNSNLVLQRDGPGPSQNESTGEPESLVGRIRYKMGDRVSRDPVEPKIEKRQKAPKRKSGPTKMRKVGRNIGLGETVLNVDISDSSSYIPTSLFTRQRYEDILSILQQCLGDQPQEVIRGACDEILVHLKTPNFTPEQRREGCQEVLGPISDEVYYKLYHSAKDLNDYVIVGEGGDGAGGTDDPAGVAVIFDEDEDAQSDVDSVVEDGYEVDIPMDSTAQPIRQEHSNEYQDAEVDKYFLPVSKIDPHWLQRELNTIYGDPNIAVATEKEILSILAISDVQVCENRLVCILKYENFEFAKLVLRNRHKIMYCTKLGQAQNAQEKAAIFEEMERTPEGQMVLEELEAVNLRKSRDQKLAMNVTREAAGLAETTRRLVKQSHDDMDDNVDMIENGPVPERIESSILPQNVLDLDSLAFKEGAQHMTNTKVVLPKDTERVEHVTYDEVIIRPLERPKNLQRRPITQFPEWTHAAFAGIDSLNPVQSAVSHVAFEQPEQNMLVCAPTGAGKTNVAVLAMLSIMARHYDEDTGLDVNAFKIVYVSPMKSLVMEQAQAFTQRFSSYGMNVRELTGDMHLTRRQLMETQLIVTTPEKWDVVTRRAGMETVVELIIFDEIHLLHDKRGPVLEALVARTLYNDRVNGFKTRLCGLSATLPNYTDIAEFLHVDLDVGLFYFGNHYRPVGLEQRYIGIKERKAIRRFNIMNEIVYERVIEEAGKNQLLVFVHSRKETARTAKLIRDTALNRERLDAFLHKDSASREILASEAEHIKTPELQELLPFGFGIHHAGLPRSDRKLVEDLFADGHIQLLVSTATLSWGVNLPAHTVIIKGTQVYSPEDGCWTELCPLSVQQMMGRAGRPQYDTEGKGIIVTGIDRLQFYLSLNNQQLPIESQLVANIAELLNAEIVLGNVQNLSEATTWLGDTYFAIRMRKEPILYGVVDEDENLESIDESVFQRRLELLAHSALSDLDRHGLVRYERRGGALQSTAMGRIASLYYLKPQSVKAYVDNLRPGLSDSDLLRVFAASAEFKYIPVRQEEIVELKTLMEKVPIPVRGNPEEATAKVAILLQSYISRFSLDGYALVSEMAFITQNAGRIYRALYEICLRRNWSQLAQRLFEYCKMVEQRMWSVMIPLRQFKSLPEELLLKLERNDFGWDRFFDLSSVELGELCRQPKLGKTLHRLVHMIPKLDLQVFVQPLNRTLLSVELLINPNFEWDVKLHGASERFWLLLEDDSGEELLHSQTIAIHAFKPENVPEISLTFTAPILEPLSSHYFLRLVSERWIGSVQKVSISFDHLILPEQAHPHCELLDLQPLPIAALSNVSGEHLSVNVKLAQALFGKGPFNAIQTQIFPAIVDRSDSFYVSGPSKIGKFGCAEIAILRCLCTCANATIAILCPFDSVSQSRYMRLQRRFGNLCQIVQLSGDLTTDLAKLPESSIIVGIPKHWEILSRRWKTRSSLQKIDLVVAEGLELLNDGTIGPELELVLSRFRFIAAQMAYSCRIMALSGPVSNALDIAGWLGVSGSNIFNFGPSTRSFPLVVSLQSYDQHDVETRQFAMFRGIIKTIINGFNKSPESSILVFASDRRYCRLLSLELHAKVQVAKGEFTDPETIDELQGALNRERALKDLINSSIGYCHEGFSNSEVKAMEHLFENGDIRILVATGSLAWTLETRATMVIIADVSVDASNRPLQHKIYPQADLNRMVNFACIQQKGGASACILHETHQREHIKRTLNEALPVESAIESRLEDLINAEIVQGAIGNAQDAIDWLTWTLYYRRLPKNPNYYSLSGSTGRHLSEHLSELVETSVGSLVKMGCIQNDEDEQQDNDEEPGLQALNLGYIAAFYGIACATIAMYSQNVNANTRHAQIINLLANAHEFVHYQPRPGERVGSVLLLNAPHKVGELLKAHMQRCPLSHDLMQELHMILGRITHHLCAMVDVASSGGWLKCALQCMETCQRLVQALNPDDSPLKQLPHFDANMIQSCAQANVMDPFDIMGMEDPDREALLSHLDQEATLQVATFCNNIQVLNITHALNTVGGNEETAIVEIQIERDGIVTDSEIHAPAPFWPHKRKEQWWAVVGNPETDRLFGLKRFALVPSQLVTKVKVEIEIPKGPGTKLFIVSDSLVGTDYQLDLE
ncbi:bifunctional Immunoglobulin E-set/Sec63 domain/P-loop containing nucleoside triphosphate hydrolase/Winged helix-like DNA-binding domain superfamily/C2 domain superfamily/Helicase [Babesia duncani]|uniref:U5 small nuclear ribonucleoprotein 200 kDa helicase n=1 Tax=Babesia duncani TaxID=323732 RepID=A0AAD9PJF4_9APIC|nr:bifunctional Immunoglobulin E-set/Sec63 domain/P-loop containing nucleoside triphosphate hydrolase/Winged helix-like DNA-binding domain superfamily/C2 domain superfamily/Helicase [Babesia duncani]